MAQLDRQVAQLVLDLLELLLLALLVPPEVLVRLEGLHLGIFQLFLLRMQRLLVLLHSRLQVVDVLALLGVLLLSPDEDRSGFLELLVLLELGVLLGGIDVISLFTLISLIR